MQQSWRIEHKPEMLIGYACALSGDQDLRLQRASLAEAGCRQLFEDDLPDARCVKPELTRMLERLRDGDLVVITQLDRLADSTKALLAIATRLRAAQAGLRSLAEPWADTSSGSEQSVLDVFAGIADFERQLILKHKSSGRVAAKARGVRFGRPPKLSADQVALGKRAVAEGASVHDAAELLGCHQATLYRALSAQS